MPVVRFSYMCVCRAYLSMVGFNVPPVDVGVNLGDLTSTHNSPPAAAKERSLGDTPKPPPGAAPLDPAFPKPPRVTTPEPLAEGRGPLHSRLMRGCQRVKKKYADHC
jgi:hypothetical protein